MGYCGPPSPFNDLFEFGCSWEASRLLDIQQPNINLTVEGHNYGRFIIEPLERGYGMTLGHALRRILLRSLPGAAIVRARIPNIWHEFATIPGVREDVTEIVLNLKRVRVKTIGPVEEARARLYAEGKGIVTAGDIQWPGELEVVNPEFPIATLDQDDAVLEMDLIVQTGHGYLPAEAQEAQTIGEIPIDAIFTPIVKVNYVVEHTRVGPQTDYDKLSFEIQTDGTIDPEEALTTAAQILVEHARLIAGFEAAADEVEEEGSSIPPEIESRPLADLGLPPRILNALRSKQIEYVGQVLQMNDEQLLSIRNFGPKALDDLMETLSEHGYTRESLNIPPNGGAEEAVS